MKIEFRSRCFSLRMPMGHITFAVVLCLLAPVTGWTADRQMLHGHVPAATANLAPLGRLDGSQHLKLAISLPLRNPGELARLLKELYDPASPNYRKFLTPAQFAERFGPTQKDYDAVAAFATAKGLTVTDRYSNRLVLDVEGPAAKIEAALHVKMQQYRHPREKRMFYAPDAEPSLDLATPVMQISGLDNLNPPRPLYQPGGVAAPQAVARPAASGTVADYHPPAAADAAPNSGGSAPNGAYMGNDFRAAYVPGSTLTGAGQTLGLVQFDGYTAGDITYYEDHAGLPHVPLTNVLLDGFSGTPTGTGGEVEVSLDIETAVSMAQGLSGIIVYEGGPTGNWHDVLNRIATDNLAKQISCSWYIPNGVADPAADVIFQQMAAQGQTFFTASGDYDAFTGLIPFPGDTPFITEVGGTTLTTNGSGGPWLSETAWNRNNGVGTGGGVSTQYTIPSWQQGISMTANLGSTTMRNVPDVALTAENVYVRANGVDQNVGGTSCASPLWAAFLALVNQQAVTNGKPPMGFLNPAIYAIGAGANFTSDFHDITTGNNFSSGSPAKFPAVSGYDLCTGWGSPMGTAMINALAGPPGPVVTTGTPLPNGVAGTTYSKTLAATGGATPYSWSVSAGNLPSGLSMGGDGSITGTPDTAGVFNFTVQVTDSNNVSSTAALSLTIYVQGTPVITTGSPLPSGTASLVYNQALAASGGVAPYAWSVSAGSLPSGLSLSSDGVISGTPGTSGTSSFTLEVMGSDGLSSTTPFVMVINPAPLPPAIVTTSLPNGAAGVAYSQTLTASGGSTPYAWSIASGNLPPGLTLSSGGVISGTPNTNATYNFTVMVTGADGLFSTKAFALTIYPAGTLLNGSFETANFSNWIVTDLASPFLPLAVRANGFSPGYGLFSCTATDGSYSATSGFDGSTPGVIRVAQDIAVSASTPFLKFDYRAGWDMLTYPGSTKARTFAVTIQPGGGGSTLLTALQLTAPAGTKNLDTGVLSGIVDLSAFAGTTVRVCFDATVPESHTGPAFLELDNVRFAASSPPFITTASPLPAGFVGTAYNQTLAAIGGNAPYAWSIASGALPGGLSLGSTGVISGTPTGMTTASFVVMVTDAKGVTATKTFSLTTSGAPVLYFPLDTDPGWARQGQWAFGHPNGLGGTQHGKPDPANGATGSNVFGVNLAGDYSTITGGPYYLTAGPFNFSTYTGMSLQFKRWLNTDYQPFVIDTVEVSNNGTTWTTEYSNPSGIEVADSAWQQMSYDISAVADKKSTVYVRWSYTIATGAFAYSGWNIDDIAFFNTGVVQPSPPVITSAAGATAYQGLGFTYQIAATNNPMGYGAAGLPDGLGVDTATGLISGVATTTGISNVTISASNAAGTGSANLVLSVVTPPLPPVITSDPAASGTQGVAFSYQIAASNNPASYGATGLPAGLVVNTATGLISGTPTGSGTGNATITATNAGGTGNATISIAVQASPPVITSGTSATATRGQAFIYQIVATNSPASYGADGLPDGLSVNTATGLISGTATTTGTNNVAISATNPGGTGSATLVISVVLLPPPVITSGTAGIATQGNAFSYQITAINNVTSYAASGLPAGLGVNTSTGLISGTSTVNGIFPATISATGAGGIGNSTLLLTVLPSYYWGNIAGSPGAGGTLDGSGTAARLNQPTDAVTDAGGNIYVPDYYNNTIRKLTLSGTSWMVTTIAGAPAVSGTADGSGTNARFHGPYAIAIDGGGNLYVVDTTNETIRELTPSGTNWVVSTLAGSPTVTGSADGTGTNARFHYPLGIAASVDGNLYVSDEDNFTIRRLSLSGTVWTVTTIAGSPGISGTSNGTGTAARFENPVAITSDQNGNLFMVDSHMHTVRELTLSGTSWTVTTIAGSPNVTGTADGIGSAARFYCPNGIEMDGNHVLYVADAVNATVRKMVQSGTSWVVTTIGGKGLVTGAADGVGSTARFNLPQGIAVDSNGNLYLTDSSNYRVSMGTPACGITGTLTATAVNGGAFSYQITAGNNPTSYNATGLPDGLNVDTATGLISGVPAQTGTFNALIGATNAGGTGQGILTIVVQSPPPVPAQPPWAMIALPLLLLYTGTRLLAKTRQTH